MNANLWIDANPQNLAALRDFVSKAAASLGASRRVVDDLVLAVDETATNIIVHGYQGRPGSIAVQVELEGDEIVIRLYDRAGFFDPLQYPPPNLDLPLEERPEGGLGIYLARKSVDSVAYRRLPDGRNELTLRKKIK
jgi:serine/threonine-protein kinase RsbW